MPVTHSRILYKKLDSVSCFLVEVFSCTRILHQIEQRNLQTCDQNWKIGLLVEIWRFVVCVVCRCFCKFLTTKLCKFILQDSRLCVTSIRFRHGTSIIASVVTYDQLRDVLQFITLSVYKTVGMMQRVTRLCLRQLWVVRLVNRA